MVTVVKKGKVTTQDRKQLMKDLFDDTDEEEVEEKEETPAGGEGAAGAAPHGRDETVQGATKPKEGVKLGGMATQDGVGDEGLCGKDDGQGKEKGTKAKKVKKTTGGGDGKSKEAGEALKQSGKPKEGSGMAKPNGEKKKGSTVGDANNKGSKVEETKKKKKKTGGPAEGSVSVTVKMVSGRSAVVVVSSSQTVQDLKALVHEELGCEPALQRLVYAGGELKDEIGIAAVKFAAGAVIHLVMRRRPAAAAVPGESATVVKTSAEIGPGVVRPSHGAGTVRRQGQDAFGRAVAPARDRLSRCMIL